LYQQKLSHFSFDFDEHAQLMVEGAASFLLVFWSAVAALMQEMHGTLSFPMVCLVVALTVGFVLWWLGPAHFNPAVTATFAAFGYLPWAKVTSIHPWSPGVPFFQCARELGTMVLCRECSCRSTWWSSSPAPCWPAWR
jgi:hypothetical protein